MRQAYSRSPYFSLTNRSPYRLPNSSAVAWTLDPTPCQHWPGGCRLPHRGTDDQDARADYRADLGGESGLARDTHTAMQQTATCANTLSNTRERLQLPPLGVPERSFNFIHGQSLRRPVAESFHSCNGCFARSASSSSSSVLHSSGFGTSALQRRTTLDATSVAVYAYPVVS